MQVCVLKTDGGPHPPEKWAFATATHLVQVSPNADALLQRDAFLLQMNVADAIEKHYTELQKAEADALALNGDDHLAVPIDPIPYVEAALADVIAAAKGSKWEKHFQSTERKEHESNAFLAPGEEPLEPYPSVQDVMKTVLATHFATAIHVHRSWHADKNPDGPNAQAFRAAHHPGPDNPIVSGRVI